jgi:hypothetical protein
MAMLKTNDPLGGIGKTALAYGALTRAVDEKIFDHVVWTSAKREHFVGERVKKSYAPLYSFDMLLNEIGRQCDRPDIPGMQPGRRLTEIEHLLRDHRVLIVLDNLETAPDRKALVEQTFQILNQDKLLITSRYRVTHERAFTLNLKGFPVEESVMFLREGSSERGIQAMAQAAYPKLVEIHEVTGGAPLAMRLVVGHASRKPLDVVLSELKGVEFEGQTYPLYRFLYLHSWKILDMPARRVLVEMSVFPPLTGGAVADVEAVSQVPEQDFWPAMEQLVILSLVDKIGVPGKERFALHTLTQHFVKSDITKEWSKEKEP